MSYKILLSSTITELETLVASYTARGWIPTGGPTLTPSKQFLMQAIYKPKENL